MGDEINYRVPVERPSKILCLGRNYVAHAKETGHDAPQSPIFFCKASSSLIPHQGTILIPAGIGRVDHEVELAVVIGKTGHAIPENKAWEYVAGYTILNDVTARTLQKNDMAASNPWFRSKSLDTFGPIGPFLVPKSLIPEPHQLTIQLKVNAEIRQQANTAQMIFKIPELIAYISKYMTLNSGDIISTGTPAGISPLADGDIVEAEIMGLGLLRNFVLDAPAL
ncbi:fumarylacetoacetate hydrolase family protein [candidate division KSB1 bacterium]|nr:fumarylacetoacetate hydrolase family protein [candidate division KSB1 bacterium]